jgi:alpha-galactosidase
MGSHRYQPQEIRAFRQALDQTGRSIVLSISPGPAPLDAATFLNQHAQMWRISDDFWDNWELVLRQFDYTRDWAHFVGEQHTWPDADMLPLGRLRFTESLGMGTPSRLTPDEQRTVVTLWSIFRSPLIIGGDLPTLDAPTIAMLTNNEVLEVNQHGKAPRQVLEQPGVRVWSSNVGESEARYIAVFNLASIPGHIDLSWRDLGLAAGCYRVHDLWDHRSLDQRERLSVALAPHASALFRIHGE